MPGFEPGHAGSTPAKGVALVAKRYSTGPLIRGLRVQILPGAFRRNIYTYSHIIYTYGTNINDRNYLIIYAYGTPHV